MQSSGSTTTTTKTSTIIAARTTSTTTTATATTTSRATTSTIASAELFAYLNSSEGRKASKVHTECQMLIKASRIIIIINALQQPRGREAKIGRPVRGVDGGAIRTACRPES